MGKPTQSVGYIHALAARYVEMPTIQKANLFEIHDMGKWIQQMLKLIAGASRDGWDSPAGQDLSNLCFEAQIKVLQL